MAEPDGKIDRWLSQARFRPPAEARTSKAGHLENSGGHQRACSTRSRSLRLVVTLMRTPGSAMSTSTICAGIIPAALTCLLTLVSAGGVACAVETPSLLPSRPVAADGELRLFLAGDSIITRPWSADRAPDFLALVGEIRGADAAVVNLEMLFHTYKGYAQADSGGTYMAADPEIAAELAWAGVDMVANANNHTFDYGSLGVLENLDNVAKAGLVLAGAGKDLQSARAPAYFPHADGTVALVSAASSFVPYGKASRSRPDMHGRPGLNPLTAKPVRYVALPNFLARGVRSAANLFDLPYRELDAEWSRRYGLHIRVGDGLGLRWGRRIDSEDLADNLTSVREAAAKADLVVGMAGGSSRPSSPLPSLKTTPRPPRANGARSPTSSGRRCPSSRP